MHKQWAHQTRELHLWRRYRPRTVYGQTDSSRSLEDSVCVCVCVCLGVAEDSNTCGLLDQADKGQVNAVCLLSSSRTSATQRASNTGSYQMTATLADILQHKITSGSSGCCVQTSKGSPGRGLLQMHCEFLFCTFSAAKLTSTKKGF